MLALYRYGTSFWGSASTEKRESQSQSHTDSLRQPYPKSTRWDIEHQHPENGDHQLHYTKHQYFEGQKDALCSRLQCDSTTCEATVRLDGENISYSSGHDTVVGIQSATYKVSPLCTQEDLQTISKDIKQRLPQYEDLKQSELLSHLGYDLALISIDTSISTSVILLVRDVMLQKGYSPQAASWGSYLVAQAFAVGRVGAAIYQGVDMATATLPLLVSSAVYYGLYKTGVATERTATWCSNATSVTASTYLGMGFFRSALHTGSSILVAGLVAMGEATFADRYLTGELTKRLDEVQSLHQQCQYALCDETNQQLNNLYQEIYRKPQMHHYAQIYQYQVYLKQVCESMLDAGLIDSTSNCTSASRAF